MELNVLKTPSHPERHLHAPDELVRRLSGGSVQRLLDELPQSSAVLDLVDLAELVRNVLLRVEVPEKMKRKKMLSWHG